MSETGLQIAQETALQGTPKELIQEASAQARALVDLIEKQKLYSVISGRKYVRVEGWVPLARMNGVIPREVENVEHADGHFVARVQLVRIADGSVLTEASSECGGPSEPTWQGRAPYARRSMAATRATGKACRLAYSWIMALGGYEPTPAEEMPINGEVIDLPPPPEHPKTETRVSVHSPKEPNQFWAFDKKGVSKVGVVPGDRLTDEVCERLGLRKWEKDGCYYGDYQSDLVKELKALGGSARN